MNEILFPTQIIVTKELNIKLHPWLKALSDKLGKQEIKSLLEQIEGLSQAFDKRLADSVLEVAIRANQETIEQLRGDENMCQALLEIMEPEINKIVNERTQKILEEQKQKLLEEQKQKLLEEQKQKLLEERKQSILQMIITLHEFGVNHAKIKEALIHNYKLSPEEAEAYLCAKM